jgi:hypothetical protein
MDDRSAAKRHMVFGGMICVVGLVITFGSYAASSGGSGGGRYVMAWGAILFGAIRFVYGLVKLRASDRG